MSESRTPPPVRTFGLTHVALAVRDPQRSMRFYQQVVGAQAVYEQPGFVQAQTPGSRDVLVFERRRSRAGRPGGWQGRQVRDPSRPDPGRNTVYSDQAGIRPEVELHGSNYAAPSATDQECDFRMTTYRLPPGRAAGLQVNVKRKVSVNLRTPG